MSNINYSIEIDHHRKIIRYTHIGETTHQDIGLAWNDLLTLPEFTHLKYNLLTDYRQATNNIEVEDIETICDILLSLGPILNGKKQAMMVSQPLETAMSVLFEGEVNQKTGFIVMIFSTEEAALKWLSQ